MVFDSALSSFRSPGGLRSKVPDGCGFGEGTSLVRRVGPWPRPELVPVFGGPSGFHFPQLEGVDDVR